MNYMNEDGMNLIKFECLGKNNSCSVNIQRIKEIAENYKQQVG